MDGYELRRLRHATGLSQTEFAGMIRARLPGCRLHWNSVAKMERNLLAIEPLRGVGIRQVVQEWRAETKKA